MGKDQSLKLPYPLILASTSPYRKELFTQLGWKFQCESPEVDEETFKNKGLSPENLAIELSRAKAKAVYLRNEGSCVIGSDQVCTFKDNIFSKPQTPERAIEQLRVLQGGSHKLLTAVTIINPDTETTFLNTTILHMRDLTEEDIHHYIKKDLPLDCAGSYKLEKSGIKLFEQIEMSDHTAIIGLPLIQLSNILIGQGYPL
jgi:septum formation protein